MGRKILETSTESMFYVLMACCGRRGAARRSPNISPQSPKAGCGWGRATLYTILAKFEEVG